MGLAPSLVTWRGATPSSPSPPGCLQRIDVTTGGAGARELQHRAPAPVALARSLAALAARSPRRPKVRAAQQLRGRVRPHQSPLTDSELSRAHLSCCRRPLPALASLPPTRSAECSASEGAEAIGDTLPKRAVALLASAVVAWSSLLSPLEASALDTAKVGSCLLENCQSQLAACIADEKCAESLVCLNRCNGTKDEAACQIRCGDLYADSAVKAFNKCAVSTRKCVPQRVTAGAYPLPASDAVVEALDVAELEGRWYISAGLNKLFDTFPCQVHYFTSPEPGKLFIKVNWRVARPNGQFYERSDLQRFVQDASTPAALFNHDNEVLHYQDDWYIAAMRKDEYFLVYYRGRNDAWDGYGGAVVYTREPSLKAEYVPELSAAAAKLGLSWSDFELTDNSCPPPPMLQLAPVADLDVLADDVRVLESEAEAGLENSLQSFSRGFTVLKGTEQAAEATARAFIDREESVLKAEFAAAEKALADVERRVMVKDILAAPGRALAALLGRG